MSHECSGSEKLKEKCQTIASLSAEEIAQVAGGYEFKYWWIRGVPADIFKAYQPQVPGNIVTGGFGF
jgi:hypothetical protein